MVFFHKRDSRSIINVSIHIHRISRLFITFQAKRAKRFIGVFKIHRSKKVMVSATAMTAAGAHLILFSTGRGTPFSAPAPTLKISTNTPLAQKKSGWIDFNTGVIADGEKTIDEAAKDLLDLVIRVASGEQTKAEKHGFREISIFKDGVVL